MFLLINFCSILGLKILILIKNDILAHMGDHDVKYCDYYGICLHNLDRLAGYASRKLSLSLDSFILHFNHN